jgi:multidrug efflux system outer membrane protein
MAAERERATSRRRGLSPLRVDTALLLAALSLGLAGCAQMPGYERPPPPVPERWPATAAVEGEARLRLPADWRAALPDPRLQALVEAALAHNRDLRLATARIAEARAQLASVDAALTPSADATATAWSKRSDRDTARHFEFGLQSPAFELDLWGRLRSLDEAARQRYLASQEAAQAVRLVLIGDVAETYLTQLELTERLRLTEATLASRAETREIVARRRDVGLAGELDLLQADGALALARAELASLRRQLAAAGNALTLLTGASLDALPPGRGLEAQRLVADLAPGLPAEVLLRRPDVRAAEAQLKAANADIGAARATFFPNITLTAALGFASRGLSDLFDAASGTWLFQPALRWPLFDAGRTQAGVDLAEARKLAAVAEYERTIQQAFREVADGLAARRSLVDQLAAQQVQARIQAERLSLAEARFRAGLTSFLDVLDAQRELYAAEQAVVQTRRAWLVNAVRLYQALGGGTAESSSTGG